MPYKDQPAYVTRSAPKRGRVGAEYRAACAVVRARVAAGGRDGLCWFWRRPGFEQCPGRINLALPPNHRWAFTAHHKHRLMDGGAPVVRAEDMAPAHRSCNSIDGLRAQNERRARRGVKPPPIVRQRGVRQAGRRTARQATPAQVGQDRTSERW